MAFLQGKQTITITVRCKPEQATQLNDNINTMLNKLSLEEINDVARFIGKMNGIEKTMLLKKLRENL